LDNARFLLNDRCSTWTPHDSCSTIAAQHGHRTIPAQRSLLNLDNVLNSDTARFLLNDRCSIWTTCLTWTRRFAAGAGHERAPSAAQDRCSRSLLKIAAQDRCSRLLLKIAAQDCCSRLLLKIAAQDCCSRLLLKIAAQDRCSTSLLNWDRALGQFPMTWTIPRHLYSCRCPAPGLASNVVNASQARDTDDMETDSQHEPAATVKPKRRWLQFSTRALLVVVTALCVALGIVGWCAERQRRAVAAIKAVGGDVVYFSMVDGEPDTWPQRWMPRDVVDKVAIVGMNNNNVTDTSLAHLACLSEVEEVYLASSKITDEGLMHLSSLSKLEIVDLRGTNVTRDGVRNLQRTLPNCTVWHWIGTGLHPPP
jgi:hypothetical protein